MDKKQFLDMVSAPGTFTSQDRGWLKAMLAKYPYSSVISTLALMADLSVCNPAVLDRLLADATVATPQVEDSSFDILNEINTFQEVSFKTAPKSVILSNFLQVDPSKEREEASLEARNHDANDKKSLTADISLGTETLAVILEKQGRYDKALAIYKNLLVHNPEKSSIFAPRIERLESLINSK